MSLLWGWRQKSLPHTIAEDQEWSISVVQVQLFYGHAPSIMTILWSWPTWKGKGWEKHVSWVLARVVSFLSLLLSSPCFSLPHSPLLFLGFHLSPPFPPFFLKYYRLIFKCLHPPLQPSSWGSAPALLLFTCYHLSPQNSDLIRSLSCSKTPVASKLLLNSCLCSVAQSYLTLCNPKDCSPPGSSVHGIFQARIVEWVAISFSTGAWAPSYQPSSPGPSHWHMRWGAACLLSEPMVHPLCVYSCCFFCLNAHLLHPY